MLTRLILVILISLPSLFAQSVYNKTPRWYTNPPVRKGLVYGVGSGKLKMEAIIRGLSKIGEALEVKIESEIEKNSGNETKFSDGDAETIKSSSQVASDFLNNITEGKFEFRSMTESFIKESGPSDNKSVISNFEYVGELTYNNDEAMALIKYYMQEIGVVENIISTVDAVYTNTDESKIIEELENYGFSFKYAQDRDGRYYTLIGIKEDVLLK